MKPPLIVTVLAAALATDAGDDVHFVDASLEPDGELLGVSFVDVDGDGRDELVLALQSVSGADDRGERRRELHVHRIADHGISAEPTQTVGVLDEVLAFSFADVRPEPGRELVFLTPSGAWSYSLTIDGYRGNARRLAETALVFDVPDPDSLPRWRYAFAGEGGDWILLPRRGGYSLWGPDAGPGAPVASGDSDESAASAAAEASYSLVSDFTTGEGAGRPHDRQHESSSRTEIRLGPDGMKFVHQNRDLGGLLLPEPGTETRTLLDTRRSYRAPGVLDLNGDGRLDLVSRQGDELQVHEATASGEIPATPTRIEPLPPYLEEGEVSLELADLDGDGLPDVLARHGGGDDDLENQEISLFVSINDGRRLLSPEPRQVLRFEAAELRVRVTDVDGDGRPDLALRKFEMPGLMDAVTGLEFTLTHLIFLGEEGERPFGRKPVLKQSQTFDETTLQDAIKNRELAMDCDGDGIADLVEVDFRGNITIKRLEHDESFFGGGTWSLERSPWLRFDTFGSIASIQVRDLNDDGLGDIISEGPEALTVLLSVRGGRDR